MKMEPLHQWSVEAMNTETELVKTHAPITPALSSSWTNRNDTPSTLPCPSSQPTITPVANPYVPNSIVTPSSVTKSPSISASTVSVAHSDVSNLSTTTSTNPEAVFDSECQTLDHALKALRDAPKTSGALFASGTSNNAASYALCKKKLLAKFIDVMKEKGEKYAYLLVPTKGSVCNPSFPKHSKLPIVFSLLSGSKAKKVKILNDILIDWVSDKKVSQERHDQGTY